MKGKLEPLLRRLNQPTNGMGLAGFRILFGALMVFEALHVFVPWTEEILSPKRFHLNYPAFSFVGPLPSPWHHFEPYVLAVLATGMMIGYRFRLCTVLFTIVYAHIFLVDQLVFNNHLYLYLLMAGLLAATPAAAFWSVDSFRKRKQRGAPPAGIDHSVPGWSLYLLRFQLLVVYFYGGVAKMNSDWLQGEPVRYWLHLLKEQLWLGELLAREWAALGISYGGLLFDLSIGFLLLNRKTFLPAALAAMAFHGINSQLFLIGSFPVFGILSLIIFLPSHIADNCYRKTKEWFSRLSKASIPDIAASSHGALPGQMNRLGFALVAVYVLFQITMPMRPWFQKGNPSWTDGCNTFAWRMMLHQKDAQVGFIISKDAQALMAKYPQLHLTNDQMEMVSTDPDLLYQYANWLGKIFSLSGVKDTSIRLNAVCSLNGRSFQPIIDSSVDLTKAENPLLRTASWIVPLDPSLPIGQYPANTEERNHWAQQAYRAASLANPGAASAPSPSSVPAQNAENSAIVEK